MHISGAKIIKEFNKSSFFVYFCIYKKLKEMSTYIHQVNYYECDRMGVTHHSNYIRFMEEARVARMEELGYGYAKMEEDGIVSPVMSVSCEYKKTTTFMDKIEIVVKAVEISALKVSFEYVMRVGKAVVCKGRTMHCFLKDGKPVVLEEHWPDFVRILKEEIDG